jgi:hypothetical protein
LLVRGVKTLEIIPTTLAFAVFAFKKLPYMTNPLYFIADVDYFK